MIGDSISRTYQYNNSLVTVRFGNIIESSSQVIVCTGNHWLRMDGGLGYAIKQKAGETPLIDTQKYTPTKLGDIVVSSAGELPQKHLFHITTIGYIEGEKYAVSNEQVEEFIIKKAIRKCFALISAMNLCSIAFPLIGDGTVALPLEDASRMMAESISANLSLTNQTLNVEIYVFNKHVDNYTKYLPVFESFAAFSNPLQHHRSNHTITDTSSNIVSQKTFDVFISYSRKDISKAEFLCQTLDSINVSYWIDRNGVFSGDNYKEKIVDAILSCKIFLFISSQNSNASKHTAREVGIAFQSDIPVVPVKIDDAVYAKSIYYDLVFIDWIEMKEMTKESIEKFKTSIKMHLNERNHR